MTMPENIWADEDYDVEQNWSVYRSDYATEYIRSDLIAALEAAAEERGRIKGLREAALVKPSPEYGADWLGMSCAILARIPATQSDALHRSFPEAGDGRPMPPMGDELMIAGLGAEDARFVAVQLAQNGLTLTPSQSPATALKPPFQFERYINGVLMAEGVTIERQANLSDAAREAAIIASRGRNGEVPVLVLITPSDEAPK